MQQQILRAHGYGLFRNFATDGKSFFPSSSVLSFPVSLVPVKKGVMLLGFIGALIVGTAAAATRPEFPSTVTITTSGADCPVAFTAATSGDYEAITFGFSDFQLTRSRSLLVCRIGIDYKFPAGWRFWRPSVNIRGFQYLNSEKQNSAWAVRSRINGGAWQSQPLLTTGPIDDNFQVDLQGGEARKETPIRCGAKSAHIDVEIIASLFAMSPAGEPVLALDSIDTEIDWQRCQP